MKLKDIQTFIKKIKLHKTAFDFIEDKSNENESIKGFIYETLWDICIKFNILKINGNDLEHLFGKNINNLENIDDYKKITYKNTFEDYLKSNWRSGNKSGYSDISFRYNDENNKKIYIISSVKYINEDKKISEYDIANLCTIIQKIFKEDNYKIFLFIKNKKKFIEKAKLSKKSSNLILRLIDFNNIYDLIDLEKHYLTLRTILNEYNFLQDEIYIDKFKTEFLKIEKNNVLFKPKFHQKLFINKIIHDFNDKRKIDNKDFLIGAIPRTGKTYIMAGIILDYIKYSKQFYNFLIITPVPTETMNQYKELFESYYDFHKNKINFIAVKDNNIKIKTNYHNVFAISIQRLMKKDDKIDIDDIISKGIDNNIKKYFDKIKFDILFLDEAHFCLSTYKSELIIDEITSKYSRISNELKRIFITATFNKPINKYIIKNKLFWDLNDINKIKNIYFNFIDNHEIKAYNDFKDFCSENIIFKDIINKTLKDFNIDIKKNIDDDDNKLYFKLLLNDYKYYPKPILLTTIWNGLDKIFKEYNLAYGLNADFNMELLFNLNKKHEFINYEQIKELLYYYLGIPRKKITIDDKEIDLNYIQQNYYKTYGILKRIENICDNKCRTLQNIKKISQLWFLPKGSNNGSIFYICIALLKLLKVNFESFFNTTMFIICISKSDNKDIQNDFENKNKNIKFIIGNTYDVKEEINNIEKNTDKNIIILTNGRLQLGISLKNVDIVALFNNDKQSDRLYQMMFRSLTEIEDETICKENEYCSHKKYGFIVDLNPQRTIFMINYIIENLNKKDKKTIEEQQRNIVELFNIDRDFFIGKYDNINDLKKYTHELFNKMSMDYNINYNYIKELLKDKNIIDDNFIKKYKKILLSFFFNNNKIKKKIQDISVDIKLKKEEDYDKKKDEKIKDISIEDLRLKAIELISHIINISTILLLCNTKENDCFIKTHNTSSNDIITNFKKNINQIKTNKELKDIFIYSINNNLYDIEEMKSIDDYIFTLIDDIINKYNN